jgi:predicted O-linked N-acetylglucosamine transferase (SPINDLY family)
MDIQDVFAAALREQQAGHLAAAEALYRKILDADPSHPEVHYNLGIVLSSAGRRVEAVACYRLALELRPAFPEAANNLGAALRRLGHMDEAEANLREALRFRPDFADAWNNLGAVLKATAQMEDAIACFERAVQLQPGHAGLHSNLVFALLYSAAYDATAHLRAAQRWNAQHAIPLRPSIRACDNDRTSERRLRIGYLSQYFRWHCQALFLTPLLSQHDHERFEILCYSDTADEDATSARLRGYADCWRSTVGLADEAVAALIRQDRIDVLVDLTLHMAHNRLLVFARRPAPVQVTWLGYPGTTGVETIDYRLTDPWLDPPGENDPLYSETSYRLPDCFWCYDPLTDRPLVNELPARRNGWVTFGCLNNFCKVTDDVLATWGRVLHAVPTAHLVLLAPPGRCRQRVTDRLDVAVDRIRFVEFVPRPQYLERYHDIDLCLDTFPYNGHTTNLDGFWMGVPVVSRRGSGAVSRAGLCMLTQVGLTELVASSADEFVRIAVELATNLDRLASMRAGLRERLTRSPLMDAQRFARSLETAYQTMWRDARRRV